MNKLIVLAISMSIMCSSCGEADVDYLVIIDWEFINTTSYNITYPQDANLAKFNVSPFKTVLYRSEDLGPRYIEKEDAFSPIRYAKHIILDGLKYDTVAIKKLKILSSYEFERITDRHIKFIYTFKDEDFINAFIPDEK